MKKIFIISVSALSFFLFLGTVRAQVYKMTVQPETVNAGDTITVTLTPVPSTDKTAYITFNGTVIGPLPINGDPFTYSLPTSSSDVGTNVVIKLQTKTATGSDGIELSRQVTINSGSGGGGGGEGAVGNILPSTDATTWSLDDVSGLINNITRIALLLAGGIAVIYIIIGGISYLTAYGDEEKANTGKKTITWAIVGIIVIILAQAIQSWIFGFFG